ncbi:MAG: hypothetical protein GYB67_13400 [Chloroflexi bacterium]|nr:hypothetical protein [Chloroflexota bacterium]
MIAAAPFISPKSVGDALDTLLYTASAPKANPLTHLLLVELRITRPELPAGPHIRDYALRTLLVDLIGDALTALRRIFGLPEPQIDQTLQAVEPAIRADGQADSTDLAAWSLLYYRYVRADLNLTQEQLSGWFGVDTRTSRRYQQYGVRLLTDRLTEAETAARRDQRQRHLMAALPLGVALRLHGRAELLAIAESQIDTRSPRHVIVTGPPGIGKTAFVHQVIQRQIAADALEAVVWVDAPGDVQFIRERLTETLLHDAAAVDLRDYLLLWSTAVVVDGIDSLADDLDGLRALLHRLSPALVCLTSRRFVPVIATEAHISLPPLAADEAAALFRDALPGGAAAAEGWGETAASVYQAVGGNPQALKLAARHLNYSHWPAIDQQVQTLLFAEVLTQLDESARRAWCAYALFPGGRAPVEALLDLWAPLITAAAVDRLRQRYILEQATGDESVRWLVTAAQRFLQEQSTQLRNIQRDVQLLLDHLAERRAAPDGVLLTVVEQMLRTGWPPLSDDQRLVWVQACCRAGVRLGRWANWRAILAPLVEGVESVAPDLLLGYSVCLRRLGEWAAAEQLLAWAVRAWGMQGAFTAQANALIEWGILARSRGNYRAAIDHFTQARRHLTRREAPMLLQTLALEEAQIAIDLQEGAAVAQMLASLPQTPRVLTLRSEAHLLQQEFTQCRTLAEQALSHTSEDLAAAANLHTIIGRSYDLEGDVSAAYDYLASAVTLLEQVGDVFALARAQANLAALLIKLNALDHADTLLAQAAQVQTQLADRVGLAVTQRNQRELQARIAI